MNNYANKFFFYILHEEKLLRKECNILYLTTKSAEAYFFALTSLKRILKKSVLCLTVECNLFVCFMFEIPATLTMATERINLLLEYSDSVSKLFANYNPNAQIERQDYAIVHDLIEILPQNEASHHYGLILQFIYIFLNNIAKFLNWFAFYLRFWYYLHDHDRIVITVRPFSLEGTENPLMHPDIRRAMGQVRSALEITLVSQFYV